MGRGVSRSAYATRERELAGEAQLPIAIALLNHARTTDIFSVKGNCPPRVRKKTEKKMSKWLSGQRSHHNFMRCYNPQNLIWHVFHAPIRESAAF